jgi:hypothetical protein
MRLRTVVFIVLLAFSGAGAATAQQSAEIHGRVADASGAMVPGVTVTLSSPVLLQPMVAVTTTTGTYRFPQLPIGVFTVKFELNGFKTIVREGIRLEIGLTAQINAAMEVSAVQEVVNVTTAAPVVDLRDTSKTNRFTQEALQSIPSARDPWVMIEQAAGVAMDRQNVGGSASGQQSNFVARGAAMNQQKWNLDGVDITDMSATGGSPNYFDFDAFEEMQVTTGGSDAAMQTPGVAVNIVTKSGSDRLKGSARYYLTPERFESNNVTDAIRRLGASSGNPIQNIKDYGVEIGGPIRRGRAWFWAGYGKQDVKVGVNNFYLKTAACNAVAANPLGYSIEDVRACLNTDLTTLNNYNVKVGVEPFKNNRLSWYNNFAEKVRNARGADDLHPIEATNRQKGVPSTYGAWGWKSGLNGTWKASDQQIVSDRMVVEAQWAHVGNNFAMLFHEDSLADVQPTFEISSGAWARSFSQNVYVRPTDSLDLTASYFLPGWLGGDHAVKAGYKWRTDEAYSETVFGGHVVARYSSGSQANFTTPYSARFYRDSITDYFLDQQAAYAQDTFTVKRLSLNLGVRWDRQSDRAGAARVPASPFQGQLMGDGRPFTFLPAIDFGGADGGVVWNDVAPRVGATYDVTGNGRNVLKASYAWYFSQRGTNDLSSTFNTIGATYVEYPWSDANADGFVQVGETNASRLIASGGQYNAVDPASTSSPNKVSADLKNQRTTEFLVSYERQLAADWGVSASYIYRKYTDFRTNYEFDPATGHVIAPSDWSARTYTPAAADCPVSGARCQAVTYYAPNAALPTSYTYMNVPDYGRTYNGFEATLRKRMANRWMMNASFAWNDTTVSMPTGESYGGVRFNVADGTRLASDPTAIAMYDAAQFAPESTSSGIDNVFVNAKWVGRISGAVQLPWQEIGVAAFYNARSGYPFVQSINIASRPNRAGSILVPLDPLGAVRLPTFQTLDARVDKSFRVGRLKAQASVDVFNLLNANTVLSQRRNQNASNANQISSILAPRVVRFGVRVTF